MENGVLGKIIGFLAVLLIILAGALFGLNYLIKQAEHASAPSAQIENSIVLVEQVPNDLL